MKALGLLEVYSFTTAVTAADICAKSGGVKVIAFDRNRPKSADAPAPGAAQCFRISSRFYRRALQNS